jgi:hypothetical protein
MKTVELIGGPCDGAKLELPDDLRRELYIPAIRESGFHKIVYLIDAETCRAMFESDDLMSLPCIAVFEPL